MLRPAADHRVHQDYISDHLELTGERKEEKEEDRSISYPNPKLTCYAKIQCRLQELWPLESHSVKKKIWGGGGGGGGLIIGITYYLQNHFQSFWAVKIFTFKFYEYSISFFLQDFYKKKKKLLQPFSKKSNEYYLYLSTV